MLSENRWQFLFSMTDLTLSEKVVQGHLRVFKPKGTKGREVDTKLPNSTAFLSTFRIHNS